MPDYCNEENLKQTESVTMHEVHKVYCNDSGLDAASLKIIELSKKIRELNATLVSERNKCNNLYQIVKKLESQSINSSLNKDIICSLCKKNNEKIENLSKNAEQEKKLKKMESIILELRQKIQILNHNLLLAKKVVEEETGEIIPNINSWLTNLKLKSKTTQNTWRGRQQQIITLKNHIIKLQSQLSFNGSSSIEDSINKNNIVNETFSGATLFDIDYLHDNNNNHNNHNNVPSKSPKYNYPIEQHVNKISIINQLQNDKNYLQEEINLMKKNNQKIKLHNYHLFNEQKQLKQQILFLINKSKHDNELIESLIHNKNNLQNQYDRIHQINIEKQNELDQLNNEQLNLKQRNDIEVKKLEEIINEKNQLIDHMNQHLTTDHQLHLNTLEHQIIDEPNNQIQSNLINSLQYDLDYIQNVHIERNGLIKLIENMKYRIEELINEKMKLEMKNAELTKKIFVKPNEKNQYYLINEKSIKSDNNNNNDNDNDNDNDQLFHYLIDDNYINNLIQKCSLSSYSMKIIKKSIKQYQTLLIQYYNENN
ncbi:unnamed protein product [Schistosoma spindalis]|nr:unnamed protein product [Schistosoma spindale]